MNSEWMKVMLDEIARKKAEAEQARAEQAHDEQAHDEQATLEPARSHYGKIPANFP